MESEQLRKDAGSHCAGSSDNENSQELAKGSNDGSGLDVRRQTLQLLIAEWL